MLSREERRELRRMESKQKEEQTLNELADMENTLANEIDKFMDDARNELENDNEEGFELIANSILYFQDLKKFVHSIKVQLSTCIRTSNVVESMGSVSNALKLVAKSMESMPSLSKNQKDFMRFKKALTRGQLKMDLFKNMMRNVNPALSSSRSKEDFSALKQQLLMGSSKAISMPQMNTATSASTNTSSSFDSNQDFFSQINK